MMCDLYSPGPGLPMRFFRTVPGAVASVLLVAVLACLLAVSVQVYRVTHPPRHADAPPGLASAVVPVEEVAFPASDDVRLSGWLFQGDPSRPFIVLCHDLGASKGSLLDLAVLLQKNGFNLLAFDFRGHGDSGGGGSSLGVDEKRDVIGAVDYLDTLEGVDTRRIGVFGVGMGAHAAALAAADRPTIKVLVLDGLYPDPGFPLVRRVYGGWSFGVRYLQFVPRAAFSVMQLRGGSERAEGVVPRLVGRDLLLLAPAGDTVLADAMQAMYRSVPEQPDGDANLVTLPATRLTDLYGEERALYEKRVAGFFRERLVER